MPNFSKLTNYYQTYLRNNNNKIKRKKMDKNSIISFLENHNTNFKLDKVLAAFEYLKNEYNVFKLLTAGSFGILILAEEIKSSDMRVIKCTQFNTIEDKKTLLQ